MKNFDIMKKIPKLPLPEIYGGDVRIVLTLATVKSYPQEKLRHVC